MHAKGELAKYIFLLALPAWTCAHGQTPTVQPAIPPLVQRALTAELHATEDKSHPMCYQLRRSSPQLTSTRKICETRDGAVAILVALNDRPLNGTDETKEQTRLKSLLDNPDRQRHRKQVDDADMARLLRILRALPTAFTYRPAGVEPGVDGPLERFSFVPNPSFDPPNMETVAMTQMSGEIWIDSNRGRIARLEGRLQQDVNFGWGILGQLDKGGWLRIEQGDVGGGQWRITRFQMDMNGRVLIKSRKFSSDQRLTTFMPVSADLSYQQAIRTMLDDHSQTRLQNH